MALRRADASPRPTVHFINDRYDEIAAISGAQRDVVKRVLAACDYGFNSAAACLVPIAPDKLALISTATGVAELYVLQIYAAACLVPKP